MFKIKFNLCTINIIILFISYLKLMNNIVNSKICFIVKQKLFHIATIFVIFKEISI